MTFDEFWEEEGPKFLEALVIDVLPLETQAVLKLVVRNMAEAAWNASLEAVMQLLESLEDDTDPTNLEEF